MLEGLPRQERLEGAEMKRTQIDIRTKLCQRLERIAAEEDMSLAELADHVLRSYAEQFGLDEDDEDEEEDE